MEMSEPSSVMSMSHAALLESINDKPFVQAYIATALWSSTDDHETPLDRNYSAADLTEDTLKQIVIDCENFQRNMGYLLERAGTKAQNGHDFWLTRNHQNEARFWDRIDKNILGALTMASRTYGEMKLRVHQNGTICQ